MASLTIGQDLSSAALSKSREAIPKSSLFQGFRLHVCPKFLQKMDLSRLLPWKSESKKNILLKPYLLNQSLTLQNRIVMASINRCKATDDNIPTDETVEYYGRRGDAGMLISEPVMVDQNSAGYANGPGIFNENQVVKWKEVANKVHDKGAKIFLQISHAGAMSHPIFRHGQMTIAPSAVAPDRPAIPRTQGRLKYPIPRAMEQPDIDYLIEKYRQAAANAVKAGCDGVEIDAGNGFLLDAFLHYHTNRRTDQYGVTPMNMCRFVLEVVDAVIKEIGNDRVAIRLSPVPVPRMQNMQESPGDIEVFKILLKALEERKIAFVFTSTDDDMRETGSLRIPVSQFIRENYKGNIVGNGGYDPTNAESACSNGRFDLIGFGRLFIANPDLVQKIRSSQPLKVYHPDLLNQLI